MRPLTEEAHTARATERRGLKVQFNQNTGAINYAGVLC